VSFDSDKMAALRQHFVASIGDQSERIGALLEAGDIDGVRALAHSLAGRSGMFGFPELGEIARAVDEADEAGLPDRARALLAALTQVSQEG
jgi:HPt (histidine-containing phosphotransfer) domain-containing protein